VPDLRDELRNATPEALTDLFEAFGVTATYDKENHRLDLAATVPAELLSETKNPDRPKGERPRIRS
jgi:hypothetical protein